MSMFESVDRISVIHESLYRANRHQVCSSAFVSKEWIETLRLPYLAIKIFTIGIQNVGYRVFFSYSLRSVN